MDTNDTSGAVGLAEPAHVRRVFMGAGVAWQVCVRAYWLLFFVRVAVDLDFTPLQLVMLGTAKEVSVLTMEIPTGVVADLYSRKWSVVIGFVVTGVAIAMAGVVDSFGLLIFSSALWGFGLTFRSGAEVAWLTGEVGSTKVAEGLILKRSTLEMSAIIVGLPCATLLSVLTSNGTALAVFGIALVGSGVGLSWAMQETGFERATSSKRAALASILGDGVRSVRRVPPLRTLVIATVLAGFASEAVDRLYVRRLDNIGLADRFDNEVIIVGAIVMAQALLALGALRSAKRTIAAQRHPEVLARILTALPIAVAVGVAMLALVDVLIVAAIGLVAAGAMRSANIPVAAAWANEHAPPASRSTVQSFVGQAHSLGEIAGGVVLGVIATTAGVPTALTLSALIFATSAAVVANFLRRSPITV